MHVSFKKAAVPLAFQTHVAACQLISFHGQCDFVQAVSRSMARTLAAMAVAWSLAAQATAVQQEQWRHHLRWLSPPLLLMKRLSLKVLQQA